MFFCCECCVLSGRGLSVVSVVNCQVEVSATSRSLTQRSPAERGASCVILKPGELGGPGPLGSVTSK